MQRKDKKKICVIVSSLGRGGAERSSAILTRMLSDLGHDVYVVSVLPYIDYQYSGTLLNLGSLKQKDDTFRGRIKRFYKFLSFLRSYNFDFIIDNRSRNSFFREIILSKFIFNPDKTIYCIRSYNLNNYFISPKWMSKYLYKSSYALVANSLDISMKIRKEYKLDNVFTIYNAVDYSANFDIGPENYILYLGRLDDDIKNLSLLIDSYNLSQLKTYDISLKIVGDGKDLLKIKHKVKVLGLQDYVFFEAYNPKPESCLKKALFTVLTSKYEGFPRVLIESLAQGTPVISVNCKSGPSEIIVHEENGLLVPNFDNSALATAMNRFIEDKQLYQKCRNNARNSIKQYSMKEIAQQWHSLLIKGKP